MRFRFVFLAVLIASHVSAHEKKITVVGAGLAGLTAAYRIEKLTGLPVEVYEARHRPGGRVYTVNFGTSYDELGGKFLKDGGDARNIKALIKEMGLEVAAYETDLNDRKYVYQGEVKSYYSALQEAPLPSDEMYALVQTWARESKNFGEVLDRLFVGQDTLRHLAELRTRGYEGNDSRDLYVDYLECFWEAYKHNYAVCHKKEKAGHLVDHVKGGNSRLIEQLAGALRSPIHYGHPLRRIEKTPEGRIQLQFDGDIGILTDYLILAIPCSTLRDVEIEGGLIPLDQKQAIATLQYGTNSKILLPVDMRLEERISDFHVTEDAVIWFDDNRSILTLYFGGQVGCFHSHSPEHVSQKIASEIPALQLLYPSIQFPGGIDPILVDTAQPAPFFSPMAMSWIHEEFSKGSYSSWGVDQFPIFQVTEEHLGETVRKVFRPVEGKIFFAGEHAALDYPATMEGAVESGERTARMLDRILLK